MSFNDELLIENVRKYSQLYDKFYHDIIQKENAWAEISAVIFKCSGDLNI